MNILLMSNIAKPNAAASSWQFALYLGLHIISLILIIVITFLTMTARSSKVQASVILFEFGTMAYILGFIQEILSDTAEGGFIACITQYFGELIVFLAALLFVSNLCSVKVPIPVYVVMTIFSFIAMSALMSTRTTRLFYKSIGLNTDGIVSRPEIDHGFFFFAVMVYFIIISCYVIKICLTHYKTSSPFQKKRIQMLIIATICCWIPYVLTISGITGGYEIPALGITVASVCLYLCLIKYGFFDSQIIAGSNAMEHGKEGILVVDDRYHLKFQNSKIKDIFGHIPDDSNMSEHRVIGEYINGNIKTYESEGKIYEFYTEPLMEGTYLVGHMIRISDETEHYEAIEKIQYAATHDTLTNLYNRTQFQKLVEQDLDEGLSGTFVIFDMDNFKGVNDNYGHQCGDAVLNTFATVLKHYGEQRLYSCRLGGDEFCVFLRNVTEKEEISTLLSKIFKFFDDGLRDSGYEGYTSLSAGAKTSTPGISYKKLYNDADEHLYTAKTTGKHQFIIE